MKMENDKAQKGYDYNSTGLLTFAWQKRWPLIIITVAAIIASVAASYLIEEKYKAQVILFPSTQASASKALLTDNYIKEDFMGIGEEEEAEQLLQVLMSDEIRTRIIKKYDLMAHYGIDPEADYPVTRLNEEFEDNISFSRTEYQSIKIEVWDKDPQMAADMANDIAALVDTMMNKMKRERALEAFRVVEREYQSLRNEINELKDSLLTISQLGVNDYESQSEVFNAAYAEALATGNTAGILRLEEKLDLLGKYGPTYQYLMDFMEYELEQLSMLKARFAEAKVELNKSIPYKYTVSPAYKPEKKAYPVRWLIVLISTASAFLLGYVSLLIIDRIKHSKAL